MQVENYKEVMQSLEEIKDRFGDCPKLINIKMQCLMKQRLFEEAYTLADKLIQVFQNKEKLLDIKELEICLCNYVTCANITGKNSAEIFTKLKQHYEHSNYLKRISEAEASFDDFCKKLGT